MTSSFTELTNWKLGEKKAIREAEPIFNTALAAVREKARI